MSDLITILDKSNFKDFTSKGVNLVDYWATWCGPCKMVAPILEIVAQNVQGKAKVGKVDVDENRELAEDADVHSIPNLCLYKDGVLVDRIIGVVPQEQIVELIKKYL